jgi:hypothetical protein
MRPGRAGRESGKRRSSSSGRKSRDQTRLTKKDTLFLFFRIGRHGETLECFLRAGLIVGKQKG